MKFDEYIYRNLSTRVGAKSTINKLEFDTEEEVPIFFYTYNYKPSLLDNIKNSSMEIGGEKRNSFSAAGNELLDSCPSIYSHISCY